MGARASGALHLLNLTIGWKIKSRLAAYWGSYCARQLA